MEQLKKLQQIENSVENEDPINLSKWKSAIMKTFGRSLIDARKAYPNESHPKSSKEYLIKDLKWNLLTRISVNNYNMIEVEDQANIIDKQIVNFIVQKSSLVIRDVTNIEREWSSSRELSTNSWKPIGIITYVVGPGGSFEQWFLEKLINNWDFRGKINSLVVKWNSEVVDKIPEYLTNSNWYKVLNILKKEGIVKGFNVNVSWGIKNLSLSITTNSGTIYEHNKEWAALGSSPEEIISSFENIIWDVVITDALWLDWWYLPLDENIIWARKYAVYNRSSPDASYVVEMNIPVYPWSSPNKSAIEEMLGSKSKIIQYLKLKR